MKVSVIATCFRFDESGRKLKIVNKVYKFDTMQDAREFVAIRKNRWRKIWGYRAKANYWYANKTRAYVAFDRSGISFEIRKSL